MAKEKRITDPDLLQEFNVVLRPSSLGIEASKQSSESSSQTHQVKLVLLQPLANTEILEACRVTDPCLLRSSDRLVRATSKQEYLNIQPLSKAWRQALMKVPPISQLTFDLVLPKEDEKSKGLFQKVYWDTAMPEQASLGVRIRDVMTLVITIATGMRIRADGDMRLEVIYDDSGGPSPRAMTLLKKQLLALAEFKVSRVRDGERAMNIV